MKHIFFREQIQFEFLDRVYFPKYSKNEKPLYIWSGACSSGEEALSIYSLCKKHDVKAKIYASDIDTNIISQFAALNYTDKSFRNDGKKFHALLNRLGTFNNPGNGSHDKTFSADPSILEDFFVQNINLCRNFNPSGQKLDLIFIRNVFIYFDSDMQKKILLNAADLMEKDALLFVSVNEIGQIGLIKDIPFAVEKWESVYYLRRL